ncbi:hypothetical protein OXYTRIMIC_528 [Oxytricha trifallax]|uniref:Ubiquitin-like protease family profile domain-containing protein n=1 Tax=Oxytricha trifallax TaxID=1172189 RepID=A0A073HYR6_9SPIT|nr:hypothetical protein OXYTRIMIC_528 [Oxytricha trifallax]
MPDTKVRESGELLTEKQQDHWREINEEWQHDDMLSGGHIKETTMKVCLKQIEVAQIKEQKTSHQFYHQLSQMTKEFDNFRNAWGRLNWKHESSRYCRDSGEIKSILISISCLGSIKKCWVILRVTENTKVVDMYDNRKVVGCIAVIQKYLHQINQLYKETVGNKFIVNQITCKPEINQVADSENCGLLAILMANHLALELRRTIFQIFQMGHMKLEIGKTGVTVNEEETELVAEKRNEDLQKSASEEKGTQKQTTYMKSHVNTWVLENVNKMEIVDQQDHQDQCFSDAEEVLSRVEKLPSLSADKRKRRK